MNVEMVQHDVFSFLLESVNVDDGDQQYLIGEGSILCDP
jgi:hypothetical protein